MRTRKLFWHIIPTNLLVTIMALLAVIWYSEATTRQFYINSLTSELTSSIHLISPQISNMMMAGTESELNSLCRRIGQESKIRITVIKSSGTVIADSEEYPANMDNHSNRPEVKLALHGQIGKAQRWSAAIGAKMLYVALPMNYKNNNQQAIYILRTSMPILAIDQQLHRIRKNILAGAVLISMLAALLFIIVSRRLSRPLEELKIQAERFAQGDFSFPFTSPPLSSEVEALSSAMNRMAKQIQNRLNTIIRQRNELQTILNSMAEAVMVVDQEQNIVTINAAASRLFGIPTYKAEGKNIQSLVRNLKLNRLLEECLESHKPISGIISFNRAGNEQFLQGSAASLREGNTNLGAVLVFNDVTKIKRLENMRRDFVANVSHELMTPLTSIKGYSETVVEIIEEEPEQSKEFLKIIIKQSDRLQAIVEDLLELARLEQETENSEIALAPGQLLSVVTASEQACSAKAKQKGITIITNCAARLTTNMDSSLLEQAVVNLLTNAIKYSENNGQVEITCELCESESDKEVAIMIRDHGPGIAQEHLTRIFERFYRCDKARSRKSEQGGTGLGLAIVKHIVQLHHGRVRVESSIGQGSTFIIVLPC